MHRKKNKEVLADVSFVVRPKLVSKSQDDNISSRKKINFDDNDLEAADRSSILSDLSYQPIMSMEFVADGEEPECLCVDDQGFNLVCIMGTLNALGETCIGKLSGQEAVNAVNVRIDK